MTARVFKGLVALSILIVMLLVYRGLFGLWFTDIDTFPLISTGRIDSWGAVADIITSPLMQGLMSNALFYRPLASISWGVDELVWGMNPLGYHLTDFALHFANALLLFYFLRETLQRFSPREAAGNLRVTQGDVAALIAALIFVIHPIAMEVVPAIARRPDLLFGFFLLLMLRSLASMLQKQRTLDTGLATLFCLLGLLSKDAAVVLPAIAMAYVFCFSDAPTFVQRVAHSLRSCWPLVLATACFMVWRTLVLGGLGGYADTDSFAVAAAGSVHPYLCATFLSGNLDACPNVSLKRLIGAAAVVVASFALICWRTSRAPHPDPSPRIFAFVLLSLIALMALHAFAGTAASLRTLYTPLIFLSIAIGWGGVVIPQGIRAVGRLRDSRIGERTVHVVAGIALMAVMGSAIRGAWSGQYMNEWKASAEVARYALTNLAEGIDTVPRNSIVYLVNIPFLVGSQLLVLRERPILSEHSVQGFVDLVFPDKQLEIVGLSYLRIGLDDPADSAMSVHFEPEPARLDIQTGPDVTATRRPWFNPYAKSTPWHRNTYSRIESERRLIVALDPEVQLDDGVVFFVYLGDRVERRGITSWDASNEPPAP